MTITLPSLTGSVSIEETASGYVVQLAVTPGATERTWTASCKFVTLPEPSIIDVTAKPVLVEAVKSWLADPASAHPLIGVEGSWTSATPISTT